MLLRCFELFLAGCLFILSGSPAVLSAKQVQQPSPIQVDQEKALKYHAALQRRPNPGYLFDRFYNAWLDSSTIDDLEKFLTDKATQSSATNDRLLLAFFYAKQGEDVRALEEFRIALANDPTSAETWYEKAVIEARTLDFETALADLAKAQEAQPKQEMAIKVAQLRGKLYVRNQQNDEAIAVWDKLVSENPTDEGLMEDMIELQISEGLYEQAEKLCDKLIGVTKDPYQLVMRRLRKGDIIQRSGKRTEAIEIYGETLDKVGMGSWLEREILSQIEQLFRREDDLTGLEEHYKKLIAESPKRMSLRKSFGKLQLELGNPEAAIKAFKEIVELTPGERDNREALIGVLAGAGEVDQAIKQVQSLIEQFPKDAELNIRLAQLFAKEKKNAEAAEAIDSYLKSSDGSEYAYLRAANMLSRFEQTEKAEATYKRCIENFPDSQTAKESYAAYLYDNENKDAAIAIWNELAQGGDRQQVVRVARVLASRKENQPAFDLLFARYDEFKLDSIYLAQICSEAIALKKFEEAKPWAVQRVKLAQNYGELEASVTQALQLIDKSESGDAEITKLQQQANRGIGSTCLLAALLETRGDSQAADDLLARSIQALAADADRANEIQMLASQQVRLHVGRQDWTQAAAATKSMIEMPGGRKSVNVRRLVDFYMRDREFDSALTWTAEWKKVSPGSLLPWLTESQILTSMGRNEDSVNTLRVATQKFPDDPDLFSRLAQRYLDTGQYKDAERIYWRQYEESEKLSDKLRWTEQLANLNSELGESSEFFKRLEERHRSNPQSIEPLLALAQAHRIEDNYEERRKWLLEATRVQPDNLPLLHEIARMEESEGDWEKAIATLQQAQKLDKTNKTRQKIARIYLRFDEAEKGYNILLEVAGGANADARDIETIADAIFGTDDIEKALRFTLPHIERFPNDYRLKYQQAIFQEELGQTEEATESFLEILTMEDDLKGLKNAASLDPFSMQVSMLKGMMPADVVDIVALTEIEDRAYSYDINVARSYSPFGSIASTAGKTIALPGKAKQAQQFALCHLIRLSTDLDENQQAALATKMTNRGIRHAPLLIALDGSVTTLYGRTDELLEEFPDSEVLLAWSTMDMMSQESADPEITVKAYNTFKAKYPELAFIAALGAANEDEEHRGLMDDALGEMSNVQNPSFITLTAIAQLLASSSDPVFGPDESGISKEQIAKLNQLLVDWYPKMGKNQMSSWVFVSVLSALEKGESPEAYLQFLDEEVARTRGKKSVDPYANFFGAMGGQSDGLIQPIQFPPESLVNFPETVYSILGLKPENDMRTYMPSGEQIAPSEWLEKFGSHVDQAKDPMLRALLQLKVSMADFDDSDKPEEERFSKTKATIEQIMKADRPDIDAFLLASGIACAESRWADASGLLEKARNLPMSKNMRQTIDGALVGIATQGIIGELEKPENESIVASAKAAALRMRRNRMDPDQRMQLAGVFLSLGLAEEAEKMEEKIANAGKVPSYSAGPIMAAPSSDRIRVLIDDGKKESAVRLLAQQFSSLARQELQFNNMHQDNWEIKQFKQQLASYRLTKEILEHVDPGESPTIKKLMNFGLAQELLGDKAKAIEIYKQVLESNAKQDAVRVRLMILELETDTSAIARHMKSIQKRDFATAGYVLYSAFLQQNDLDFEHRMKTIDAIGTYVSGLEDAELKELNWAASFINFFANDTKYGSDDYLSSVYSIIPVSSQEELTEREKRAEEKRLSCEKLLDEAHDNLCRNLLKVPQLAPKAFTALLASYEARGEEIGPEFLDLAKSAILDSKETKNQTIVHHQHHHYLRAHGLYEPSEVKTVEKRTPSEFIIESLGTSSDPNSETQFNEWVEEIKEARGEQTATAMLTQFPLFRCTEEQYLTNAQTYIDSMVATDKRKSMKALIREIALEKVVQVWRKREIPASLTPMILEFKRESLETQSRGRGVYGYHDSESGLLIEYMGELGKRKNKAEIENILSELSVMLLGPREGQAELVEKCSEPGSGSQKEAIRVYEYSQLVGSLISKLGLLGPAWNEIKRLRLQNSSNNFSYRIAQYFSANNGDFEPEEIWQAYEDIGFFTELKEFDPYYFKENREQTIWGRGASEIRRIDSGYKEVLEAKLKEVKAPTFGHDLLQLLLEGENVTAEFNELLGENLEQLKAMPDEQRLAIAVFAKEIAWNNGRTKKGEPSENAKVATKMLEATFGDSVKEDIEKLMNAKRFSDLDVDSYEMTEWSMRVIGNMDQSDQEQVTAAFLKVSKWMIKERGNRRNFASDLLNQLYPQVDYDGMRMISKVFHSGEEVGFQIDSSLRRSTASFLKQEHRRLQKLRTPEEKRQKLAALKTIDALYREIGAQVPEDDTSHWARAYTDFFESIGDTLDYDKAIEWAKLEADGGKHPQLANTMKHALQINRVMKKVSEQYEKEKDTDNTDAPSEINIERLASPSEHQQELVAIVTNKDLSVGIRTDIADLLLFSDPTLPVESVWQCATVLAEGMSKNTGDNGEFRLLLPLTVDLNDPNFKENATPLARAWRSKFSKGDSYLNSHTIASAIRFFHRLEDPSTINNLLRTDPSSAAVVEVIGELVRLGYLKNAFTIWRRSELSSKTSNDQDRVFPGNEVFYTKELHENLHAFIDMQPNDGAKLSCESYFALLPDPKNEKDQHTANRDERLIELVKRFSETTFTNESTREACLIRLQEAKNAGEYLREPLAEIASKTLPADLWQENSSSSQFYSTRRILMAHVDLALGSGDIQPFLDLQELLKTNRPQEQDYDYDRMVAQFNRKLGPSVGKYIASNSQEKINELLPVLKTMASAKEDYYGSSGADSIVLFAHLISEKGDEYLAWLEEEKENRDEDEEEYQSEPDLDSIFELAAEYLAAKDSVDDQQRFDLLKQIWILSEKAEFIMGSDHFREGVQASCSGCSQSKYGLEAAVEEGLLTPETLAARGGELAEIQPVDGEIWSQVGRQQEKLGQLEDAAESFRKAIAGGTDEMEKATTNRKVEYANVLFKLKKPDEAKTELKGIDYDLLFGDNIETYDNLFSNLDIEE